MTTPRTIRICVMCITSNFERVGGQPLTLKMSIDDTVSNMLQEAFKWGPSLVRDVGVPDLELWKIKTPVLWPPRYNLRASEASAPNTNDTPTLENLLENIKSSNIANHAEYLDEGKNVIDCFEEENRENKIQALVLCPDLVMPKRGSSSEVPSMAEALYPGVFAIEALADLSPPPDCMGSAGHELRKNIFIGRPAAHFGYPNAIFDPDLAKLHHRLEVLNSADNDSGPLSKTELEFVDVSRDFLFNVIDDHYSEGGYWERCSQFFERIFGSKGHEQQPICTSATDHTVAAIPGVFWGILQGQGARRSLPHVILEAKKEKGCGHPTMQCIKDYSRSCFVWSHDLEIFKSTMFPVILIGLNGNSLEISTALTLERVVVDELLILDFKNSFDRNTTIRKLVRIASALAECAPLLENRYRELIQQNLSAYRPQRFFPHPTPDPHSPPSSPLPTLTYLGRLDAKNRRVPLGPHPPPNVFRSLFVATLVQDGTDVEVVVKFTANYNEQAHRILADEGLAPRLYACQRVIGNLFMVVMERLNGTPMSAGIPERPLEDSVFDDIRRAIGHLQGHNLVHGDLRAVNIMLEPNQKHAKVVDFDWAGTSGTDRYPLTMNKGELADEWHPAVVAGGPMETNHDVYALNEVLIPKYNRIVD